MHGPNVDRVLSSLSPANVLPDIGGWARPFSRANYALDAEPCETRGFYGAKRSAQGRAREHFDRETWIQRDVCERSLFPFQDKSIDRVFCGHVLYDARRVLRTISSPAGSANGKRSAAS